MLIVSYIDASTHVTLDDMVPLSKWKLSKVEEEQVKQVLILELAKISNEEKMRTLIQVLMTDTEQLMIAKRIFAFVLIDRGLGNVEIARHLHFTWATVERLRIVYKHLDETNKPVKKLIEQFETSKILKELMKRFLKYAVPAAFGKIPI
jgi:Trp operon repressor